MKIYVLMLAFLLSAPLYAQENKPSYKKEGDMVKATFYHENGEIAQVGYYLDGKLHDMWKMYNADGKKIAMGQYHKGLRTGKWFFWSEEGLKEVDFAENKVVNVIKYNNAEAIVVNK